MAGYESEPSAESLPREQTRNAIYALNVKQKEQLLVQLPAVSARINERRHRVVHPVMQELWSWVLQLVKVFERLCRRRSRMQRERWRTSAAGRRSESSCRPRCALLSHPWSKISAQRTLCCWHTSYGRNPPDSGAHGAAPLPNECPLPRYRQCAMRCLGPESGGGVGPREEGANGASRAAAEGQQGPPR